MRFTEARTFILHSSFFIAAQTGLPAAGTA